MKVTTTPSQNPDKKINKKKKDAKKKLKEKDGKKVLFF